MKRLLRTMSPSKLSESKVFDIEHEIALLAEVWQKLDYSRELEDNARIEDEGAGWTTWGLGNMCGTCAPPRQWRPPRTARQ
jgi:hypothetical protein